MAIQLGSAYGKVSIDSSGVKSGVDSAVKNIGTLEQKAIQLGATMQSVGKTMTAAITIPLALIGKQAIMTASDFVETKNKVAVVFRDMTDSVMKWSEGSAKSMHLSQQQALEAASTFGNLFIAMEIGTKESADMSMALVQLAADLGSMNNIDPTVVLAKLKSGIVGETEAVRDLGIDLRATTVEAKAMEMGFVKVNGVFSQSSLIAARYAIIMEQTKVAQGDVARTGAEFAGQLVELKAHWGDTLRILGQNLLPIVKQILTQLNQWLIWFNNADPKTQKFISTLLLIAFVAGPLLFIFGKLLPMAFSGATSSMNPFSGGIFGLIGTFVKWIGVAALVVKVLTALGFATGPVGAGILAVQAAIAGVGASIAAVALPILLIIATLGFLYWAFKNNFMGITTTAQQLWFILKTGFSQLWPWLKGISAEGLANLKSGWSEAIASMQSQITGWIDWLRNAWQNVLTYLGDVRNRIIETFRNVDWGAVGMGIINAIANGIFGGIPGLINAALQAAQSAWDAAQSVFSGSSASSAASPSSASPNDIARSMVKPANNSSSNQANVTMQFENGVSVRQVREMMEMNNEAILRHLNYVLGA